MNRPGEGRKLLFVATFQCHSTLTLFHCLLQADIVKADTYHNFCNALKQCFTITGFVTQPLRTKAVLPAMLYCDFVN